MWLLKIPILILGGVVALLLILGARAFLQLHPLQHWHKSQLRREEFGYTLYRNFAEYLVDEKRFIEVVYAALSQVGSTFNKYAAGSASALNIGGENGNASFEIFPAPDCSLIGGVVLGHGLGDSPYHMRAVAEVFAAHGYYVIGLRLPGHGTAPGALVNVKWQDWYEAVHFAARMVQEKLKAIPDAEFIVGGFSTGGALTLRYTLEAILSPDQKGPDQLFLFSPAIAVTPLALLANWHKLVAWLPLYEKFRWEEIKDEDDPFKYNSFPKNAGDQIHLLTKSNSTLADKVRDDEKPRKKMPPIFAFQSPVDATVKAEALLELFKKVGNSESELVLFDINHVYASSMKPEKLDTLSTEKLSDLDFRSHLIIVTNKNSGADSAKYVKFYEAQRQSNEARFTLVEMTDTKTMAWPEKAFALSHVCIPIAPSDSCYGQDSELGKIIPNQNVMVGEKGVLRDIADDSKKFARIRYNPFFEFVRERIEFALAEK